jgi:hypothetical protein
MEGAMKKMFCKFLIFNTIFLIVSSLIIQSCVTIYPPGDSNGQRTDAPFAEEEDKGEPEPPTEGPEPPAEEPEPPVEEPEPPVEEPEPPVEEPEPPVEEPEPPAEEGEPSSLPPFEEWITNSEILLYEQITGDTDRARWIKLALDGMGLDFTDTEKSNRKFFDEITDEKVWDLVIYSREDEEITGNNYFTEVISEFYDGASVIMEHWNLDSPMITNFDLELFYEDTGITKIQDLYGDPNKIMYSYNDNHPIHNIPNEGIELYSLNPDELQRRPGKDMGDLLYVDEDGPCVVLYGINQSVEESRGIILTCYDNRFIFQNYPTHQFQKLIMVHLWENYIYNALRARYEYLREN